MFLRLLLGMFVRYGGFDCELVYGIFLRSVRFTVLSVLRRPNLSTWCRGFSVLFYTQACVTS